MIPIISIIVPIFNVEKYLKGCLDSLLSQDIKGVMEIIAVNDASTDKSSLILSKFEQEYPHIIKVINFKNNLGPGKALDFGAKFSTGKYIGFVDSDDYLQSKDFFSKILEKLEESGADVAITGSTSSFENNSLASQERIGIVGIENKYQVFTSPKDIEDIIYRMRVVLWIKIYRRDFYINSVFSSLVRGKRESDLAMHPALFFAKKIIYVPSFGYNHLIREGSLMDFSNKNIYNFEFYSQERTNFAKFLLYQNSLLPEEHKPLGLNKYISYVVSYKLCRDPYSYRTFSNSNFKTKRKIAKAAFDLMRQNKIKIRDLFTAFEMKKKLTLKYRFLIFISQLFISLHLFPTLIFSFISFHYDSEKK